MCSLCSAAVCGLRYERSTQSTQEEREGHASSTRDGLVRASGWSKRMGDIAGSLNPTCDTTAAEGKVTLASSTILMATPVASSLGGWRTIGSLGIRVKARSKKQSVKERPTSSFGYIQTGRRKGENGSTPHRSKRCCTKCMEKQRGLVQMELIVQNHSEIIQYAGATGWTSALGATGDFNAQPINSFCPHVSGWVEPIAVRQPDLFSSASSKVARAGRCVEGTNGSSTQGRLSKRSRL